MISRTVVVLLLCIIYSVNTYSNSSSVSRSSKLLPLFGIGVVVMFENSVCTAANGLSGTCYRKRQCSDITGAYASGTCASGLGVCCVVQLGCGSSSSHNNTYFVNNGYPNPYYSDSSCTHTIKRCNSNICQVRIDFISLTLSQPNANGICISDILKIIGSSSTLPTLCGENSGHHFYTSFNGNNDIILAITTSSFADFPRSWNIKITQLACNCPSRAPVGCLMYYTAVSGIVRSLNYGMLVNSEVNTINMRPGTREMVNLNYGVCVATQPGYCSIQWRQTPGDAYSFTVTENTIGLSVSPGLPTDSRVGEKCTTDFVIVPNPIGVLADRFCGNAFPTLITASRPFVLTVVTNGLEEEVDIGNRGFSLSYSQRRCPLPC